MEDWALIRRLHVSEKVAKAEIARQLGISRNTVAKAIASVDPPEYSRSSSWFRQNVATIRPDYAPTDPADRIVYHPGDQVQCDLWFPEPKIPVEDGAMLMLPVLVMAVS